MSPLLNKFICIFNYVENYFQNIHQPPKVVNGTFSACYFWLFMMIPLSIKFLNIFLVHVPFSFIHIKFLNMTFNFWKWHFFFLLVYIGWCNYAFQVTSHKPINIKKLIFHLNFLPLLWEIKNGSIRMLRTSITQVTTHYWYSFASG